MRDPESEMASLPRSGKIPALQVPTQTGHRPLEHLSAISGTFADGLLSVDGMPSPEIQ